MTQEVKRRLVKSSLVIMAATFIARVFGLVRLQFINFYFSKEFLDSFWAAYKIPNTLRELLGEGALSVAFIPVFTYYLMKKSKKEANTLASDVFNILFVFVLIVVIAGILLAPLLMPKYVSGFSSSQELVKMAILMSQIMMPFLLLMSMGALIMGILNSKKYFAAPAFAPTFFTIGMIASVFFLHKSMGPISLAIGVVVGGVLQVLFQLPFLRNKGLKYRFNFNLKHPGVKKILILMGPAALGLGVVQINQLLVPFFASFTTGGINALQISILLIQMPQAVFAIAISTAILPTLSEQVSKSNMTGFKKTMNDGLGMILFFTIPSTIFLFFMGKEIVTALFALGGKFGVMDAEFTAKALLFYTIGLIGMGGTVLANRFFYSLQDMKTPFYLALISVAVNLGLNLLFHSARLGFQFIALANSIAVILNFILLIVLIQKKAGLLKWSGLLLESMKILLSSFLMILAAYHLSPVITGMIPKSFLSNLISLIIVMIISASVFILFCKLFKVKEINMITGMFRKNGGK